MKWIESRPELSRVFQQRSEGESDAIIRAIGAQAVRGDLDSAVDLVYLHCFPVPEEPGGRVPGLIRKHLEAVMERDPDKLIGRLEEHLRDWAMIEPEHREVNGPWFYYLFQVVPEARLADSWAFRLTPDSVDELLTTLFENPSHPDMEFMTDCFVRLSRDPVLALEEALKEKALAWLDEALSAPLLRALSKSDSTPRAVPNLTRYFLRNHHLLTVPVANWMARCAPFTWKRLDQEERQLLVDAPGAWFDGLNRALPHGGTVLRQLKAGLPGAPRDIYHRCANPDTPWARRRTWLREVQKDKPPGDERLLPLHTPLGWEALIEVLVHREEWSRLKEISWNAPPEWAARIVERLGEHNQGGRLFDSLMATPLPLHRREPPEFTALSLIRNDCPIWAPDGRHLLMDNLNYILVCDPNSSLHVDFLDSAQYYHWWRFSPDLRWFAGNTHDVGLWAWPPGPEKIAPNRFTVWDHPISSPVWSFPTIAPDWLIVATGKRFASSGCRREGKFAVGPWLVPV